MLLHKNQVRYITQSSFTVEKVMSMYHYFTFITRESNCNRKGENMKKQLVVDLDDKPQNLEEFIQCIEEYLKKNKYEYKFVLKDKPAEVIFGNKKYQCDLTRETHLVGMSWFLVFTEI